MGSLASSATRRWAWTRFVFPVSVVGLYSLWRYCTRSTSRGSRRSRAHPLCKEAIWGAPFLGASGQCTHDTHHLPRSPCTFHSRLMSLIRRLYRNLTLPSGLHSDEICISNMRRELIILFSELKYCMDYLQCQPLSAQLSQ